MAHIRVIHDPTGETLTVYWDDPEHEEVWEVEPSLPSRHQAQRHLIRPF